MCSMYISHVIAFSLSLWNWSGIFLIHFNVQNSFICNPFSLAEDSNEVLSSRKWARALIIAGVYEFGAQKYPLKATIFEVHNSLS